MSLIIVINSVAWRVLKIPKHAAFGEGSTSTTRPYQSLICWDLMLLETKKLCLNNKNKGFHQSLCYSPFVFLERPQLPASDGPDVSVRSLFYARFLSKQIACLPSLLFVENPLQTAVHSLVKCSFVICIDSCVMVN